MLLSGGGLNKVYGNLGWCEKGECDGWGIKRCGRGDWVWKIGEKCGTQRNALRCSRAKASEQKKKQRRSRSRRVTEGYSEASPYLFNLFNSIYSFTYSYYLLFLLNVFPTATLTSLVIDD